MTVTGSGSTWINNNSLLVGGTQVGTLEIRNGGSLTSSGLAVIGDAVAGGSLSLSIGTLDAASWAHTGTLLIGNNSRAILTILNGATLTTGSAGMNTGTQTAFCSVNMADSYWTNSGTLTIGAEQFGSLSSAVGIIRSVVTTGALDGNAGLHLNDGTLRITGTDSSHNNFHLTGPAVFDITGTNTFTITTEITGNGTADLIKRGSGNLELTGANTFISLNFPGGHATVAEGKLTLSGGDNRLLPSAHLQLDGNLVINNVRQQLAEIDGAGSVTISGPSGVLALNLPTVSNGTLLASINGTGNFYKSGDPLNFFGIATHTGETRISGLMNVTGSMSNVGGNLRR
jgi:T5SS/PEP-CTERM-associated repeat protein